MMKKLNLEVSIPRKLNDEWEPTIKIRIKDYECHVCVIWVLVFPLF